MTPTTNKSTFLATTNKPTPPVVGKAPRFKLNTLYEKPDVTEAILIYGPQGTGKTHTLIDMLRLGERVFLLSTDMGGSGASTITNVLRENEPDLLKNILEITLTSYADISEFLSNVPKEVWDFNPSVAVWDGFSNFQTNIVLSRVGDMTDHKKDTSTARDEGAAFDQQDWGIVKRLSTDASNAFLALRNPDTQQFPVRVVTCWQDFTTKTVNGTTTVVPMNCPMLVGQLKKGIGAAFGLVIRTKVTKDEKGLKKFTYVTDGHDIAFDKSRIKNLKSEEESFQTIWKEVVRNRKQN